MKNLYKIEDELYIISDKEKSSYCIKECPMAGLNIDRCDCPILGGCSNKVGNIILTTNDLLIKDGVQAIDDEFLEWFVKNPSCESVEVEIKPMFPMYSTFIESIDNPPFYGNLKRKIIIPKEEPLIEFTNTNDFTSMIYNPTDEKGRLMTYWGGLKEPKQELPIVNGSYDCIIQTQETLEEAAKRIYPEDLMWGTDLNEDSRNAMLIGAKWQAERSYSEDEVLHILDTFWNRLDVWYNEGVDENFSLREWFNECELKKK